MSVRHCGRGKVLSYCTVSDLVMLTLQLDGFLPVVFGSEDSVALCHACCITAMAFDHINGQSSMDWAKETTRDKFPLPPFVEKLRIQF